MTNTTLEKNLDLCPEIGVILGMYEEGAEVWPIALDIAKKAERYSLSEKQMAVLRKAVERERARAEERELTKGSKHLGEPGDAIKVNAKITLTKVVFNRWGASNLIKFLTDEGDVIVTFTKAEWSYSAEEGQQVALLGVVKKHDTYNGVNQTVITAPKIA